MRQWYWWRFLRKLRWNHSHKSNRIFRKLKFGSNSVMKTVEVTNSSLFDMILCILYCLQYNNLRCSLLKFSVDHGNLVCLQRSRIGAKSTEFRPSSRSDQWRNHCIPCGWMFGHYHGLIHRSYQRIFSLICGWWMGSGCTERQRPHLNSKLFEQQSRTMNRHQRSAFSLAGSDRS